jgi:DNA topoisomerase-1
MKHSGSGSSPDPVAPAGLRLVSDRRPGLGRRLVQGHWRFFDHEGKAVRDETTAERIRKLAIPPAWRDVWICPLPQGHIQATGRDARGRKQYRYHAEWLALRAEDKYARLVEFGRALPAIRKRVARDFRRPGLGREKVLAAMVRLLETTLIRVGNEEYARANQSYGLSTLRDRHAKVRRDGVLFSFKGKSGRVHEIDLQDERLARIVRRLRDLPGQELFQYLDTDGSVVNVGSADINAYLRETAGEEFSAKDFRTWAGTVLAALFLAKQHATEKKPTKRSIVRAIEEVAARLGNTVAVCRKSYIHPAVIEAYLDGDVVQVTGHVLPKVAAEIADLESGKLVKKALRRPAAGLGEEEAAVLKFLRRRLREQVERERRPFTFAMKKAGPRGANRPKNKGDGSPRKINSGSARAYTGRRQGHRDTAPARA